MSEERKPLWPWIAALLIGLPVLYVASFGPACWITSRIQPSAEFVSAAYGPLIRGWFSSPEFVTDSVSWYVTVGASSEVTIFPNDEPPRIKSP